jgi:hypothetical protein
LFQRTSFSVCLLLNFVILLCAEGSGAAFGLHARDGQHQCHCCAYLRFSVLPIPFTFRFLVSPPFHPHPPQCSRVPAFSPPPATMHVLHHRRESGRVCSRCLCVVVSAAGGFVWSCVQPVCIHIDLHPRISKKS